MPERIQLDQMSVYVFSRVVGRISGFVYTYCFYGSEHAMTQLAVVYSSLHMPLGIISQPNFRQATMSPWYSVA